MIKVGTKVILNQRALDDYVLRQYHSEYRNSIGTVESQGFFGVHLVSFKAIDTAHVPINIYCVKGDFKHIFNCVDIKLLNRMCN